MFFLDTHLLDSSSRLTLRPHGGRRGARQRGKRKCSDVARVGEHVRWRTCPVVRSTAVI